MQWHTIILATFVVSMTVYVISTNNDQAGWIYVLILLLGISLLVKNFSDNLQRLFGNIPNIPTRTPGTTGPF